MSSAAHEPFHERAYDDWLAHYYDDWYPPSEDTYGLLTQLFATFPELAGRSRAELDLWDCACGTGATFIPLQKGGYRPWGSDGSAAMLEKARQNCVLQGLTTDRLISAPVSWNDGKRCQDVSDAAHQRLDVIFALNNSLCHMPRTSGYLDVALRNFLHLLKPGGRLIVDTKRYSKVDAIDGVDIYRELRWIAPDWRPRQRRSDGPKQVASLGATTYFHTNVFCDLDPVFDVCRAIILTTIKGDGAPRTHALTYYPLPAAELAIELKRAGFSVTQIEARQPPLNWSYDLLVAQRP